MNNGDAILNFITMVICFFIFFAIWIGIYNSLPYILQTLMIILTIAGIGLVIHIHNQNQANKS